MPDNYENVTLADFVLDIQDDIDMGGFEEEGAAARDADDVLVSREKATRERFKETVSLTIDGYPVVIPKSVPKTDAQGNELRDKAGEPIPRNTTIYDAAVRLAT